MQRWVTLLLWLGATAIGMFLSVMVLEAALYEGSYVPTGNDSFYHARRMLDFAVGERGFYQFDARIHAPEGIWIPWPWAYDYLMGAAAAAWLWLNPASDPLAFLVHVPVLFVAVNAALFLAAARQAGLDLAGSALAMLAFALAPFVQLMHMIGRVDHHFAEFTFVLLVTLFGLRWFRAMQDRAAAIGLGIALGLAPGFHNGLFVLQIPVLVCVAILWLRGAPLSRNSVLALAAALFVSTLLIVLPSEPFLQGRFEFGLLSWFHLYAAGCSSVVFVILASRKFDRSTLLVLAALCMLLIVPILGQVRHGTAFLSRELPFLADVLEAMSPFVLASRFDISWVTAQYSWLILFAPLLIAYFGWRIWKEREPRMLFYAIMTVFGLAFMLTQFRFYYFGLFALITGCLVAVQPLIARFAAHRGLIVVGLFAALLIAYQPPLRHKLFDVYALGAAPLYERARPIFLELAQRCSDMPGLVLANQHDGNYLLFHTDCSVVANTFMLTQEDEARIDEIRELMRLTPAALRTSRPDIRYVVLRIADFIVERDGRYELDPDARLATALLMNPQPPEGFELVQTITLENNGEARLYAKAFAIR